MRRPGYLRSFGEIEDNLFLGEAPKKKITKETMAGLSVRLFDAANPLGLDWLYIIYMAFIILIMWTVHDAFKQNDDSGS